MKSKVKRISYKEWLSLFGNESCCGCHYNIPHLAKCTYKKSHCYRYDLYVKPDIRFEQLSLF